MSKPTTKGGLSPTQVETASGCDSGGGRDVCIYVYGDGLYVDQWDTRAFGNWGCTNAYYKIDGNVILTGPTICPNTPDWGMYVTWWDANRNFQDGNHACNQWRYSVANACIWIEA